MTEREKVKIPKFVADYIKDAKCWDWDIQDVMKCVDDEECAELLKWFYEEKNMKTFILAWLYGYEVEIPKKKLYTITLKPSGQQLFYHEKDEEYSFSNFSGLFLKEHHTRKELEEAGFGWVFDCPGIEVEEVQDD